MTLVAGCSPTAARTVKNEDVLEQTSTPREAGTPTSAAPTVISASIDLSPTPNPPTATPLPAVPATSTGTSTIEPAPTPSLTPTLEPTQTEALSPTTTFTATVQIKDPPGPPLSPGEAEALAQHGMEVYLQQYCGVCHKLEAANTAGIFGPEQTHVGTIAGQRIQDPGYTGVATTATEYIRESILNPSIYLVEGYEQSRHHMPAFTHLSEADVEALVQMLLRQK